MRPEPTGVRAVADTNIVVSGLLWHGASRRLLEVARAGAVSLYTSDVLMAELLDVLPRAKFATKIASSGLSIEALVRRYALLAPRIIPAEIGNVILEDPDDDALLACALAARADFIISGDKRVRNLKHYHYMRIVNVTEALAILDSQTR